LLSPEVVAALMAAVLEPEAVERVDLELEQG